MKSYYKSLIILLPSALALTACGLGLKEVYPSDGYNSPVFRKNYYRVYPNEINPDENNKDYAVSETLEPIVLNESQYETTYDGLKRFDPDVTNLDYSANSNGDKTSKIKGFGETKKLNLIDDQFKYGYISKLFDGALFCNGHHELARVQMDERGFGAMFEKELIEKDYFAANFKMVFNDPEKKHIIRNASSNPKTTIELTVTFYCKLPNVMEYKAVPITARLENVPSHQPEVNGNTAYMLYSFSLKDLGVDLSRCRGFSMSYKYIYNKIHEETKKEVVDEKTGETSLVPVFDHAIMLYEVLMPNSSWR